MLWTYLKAHALAPEGERFYSASFSSPMLIGPPNAVAELLSREEAFIIYESPFRILKTLGELKDLDDTRRLVLGREMTKAFEQFIYGTPSDVISELKVVKGEFALVVLPPSKADTAEDSEDGDEDAD